jgi:hypothetical protein
VLMCGPIAELLRPASLQQENEQRVRVFADVAADLALVEPRLVDPILGPARRSASSSSRSVPSSSASPQAAAKSGLSLRHW